MKRLYIRLMVMCAACPAGGPVYLAQTCGSTNARTGGLASQHIRKLWCVLQHMRLMAQT